MVFNLLTILLKRGRIEERVHEEKSPHLDGCGDFLIGYSTKLSLVTIQKAAAVERNTTINGAKKIRK